MYTHIILYLRVPRSALCCDDGRTTPLVAHGRAQHKPSPPVVASTAMGGGDTMFLVEREGVQEHVVSGGGLLSVCDGEACECADAAVEMLC